MTNNIHLITNCSATQSVPAKQDCVGAALPADLTMEQAADEWFQRISKYEPEITPAKLYRGIAFNSVSKAKQYVEPEHIHISSIGQGFVGLQQAIVPYDLSIDPEHAHSLTRIVTQEPFSATYWWSLINTRLRETSDPITELVRSASEHDDGAVIVALSSRFLVMIVGDLVNAVTSFPEFPLRIILTSTSAVVPHQLSGHIVRYDRRLNTNTIGNRNDLPQRAALHFLNMIEHNGMAETFDQQAAITTHLDSLAPPITGEGRKQHVEQVVRQIARTLMGAMEKNPQMKTMDPDRVQTLLGIQATTAQFRRAFRKARGQRITTDKDEKQSNAALKALEGIQARLAAPKTTGASWGEEEKALDALQMFSDMVRQSQPDAKFTSTEVWTWAEAYFKELGDTLPTSLKSVAKTAHLLKNYHEDIGMTPVTSGQQGGQVFMLSSPEDDIDIDWDDEDEAEEVA